MTSVYTKPLNACLVDIPDPIIRGDHNPIITGIAWDSREVKPGDAFFALIGGNVDAHQFIKGAIERGAAAVIGTQPIEGLPVPYVQLIGDDRGALAKFSAAFYDYPSKKLVVIGITGTDGKTTTSNITHHILRKAGVKSGLITSVNAQIGDQALDTGFHVTTPESPDVQRYLALMVDSGLTHVVLEVTSHGLAQKRVDEVAFDLAGVTNVTHEHFDFHGDYQSYLGAKRLLVAGLSAEKSVKGIATLAVVNKDDQSYPYMAGISQTKTISYSSTGDAEADLRAEEILSTPSELRFRVVGLGEDFTINTPLIGRFNVANSLAAIGLTVFGLGLPVETVRLAFKTASNGPGRMERIDLGQDFLAIVDFAHTPNAMKQSLITARDLTKGKVIAVFGSAGLRDVQKRMLMPEIAVGLADETILTAEDPRTESLDEILADMAEGALRGGGVEGVNFWRVPDRVTATRMAIERAQPGDLVITLGKGHEQSMCFGEIEYPWDDRTVMKAALAEHLGIEGPEMPLLPTTPKN